ncbi:MAG: hypothetical protein ACOCWM_04010 [Cyclobacteriaceae bacterium]
MKKLRTIHYLYFGFIIYTVINYFLWKSRGVRYADFKPIVTAFYKDAVAGGEPIPIKLIGIAVILYIVLILKMLSKENRSWINLVIKIFFLAVLVVRIFLF